MEKCRCQSLNVHLVSPRFHGSLIMSGLFDTVIRPRFIRLSTCNVIMISTAGEIDISTYLLLCYSYSIQILFFKFNPLKIYLNVNIRNISYTFGSFSCNCVMNRTMQDFGPERYAFKLEENMTLSFRLSIDFRIKV